MPLLPVGGPVGDIVVIDNTVATNTVAAPPLPLSGAMDPRAVATMKTRDGAALVAARVTVAVTEEEKYNGWKGADP